MSFLNSCLKMEMEQSALLDSGDPSKTTELVKSGQQLDPEFWNHFISLCSDIETMGELLNVSTDEVSSWPQKIKEELSKINNEDEEKERSVVQKTGE